MKLVGFFFGSLLIISMTYSFTLAVENPESFFKQLEDVCPSGKHYGCKFCEPVDWKVDSKVCISLQYHPRGYSFSVNLTWNDYDLNNEIIAAKNPALVCGKISKFLKEELICIHVSNLSYDSKFHGLLEVSLGVCKLMDEFGNVGCLERHKKPELSHYHMPYWILPIIFLLSIGFILSLTYFCYKKYSSGQITYSAPPMAGQQTIVNNFFSNSWAPFYEKKSFDFLSSLKAPKHSAAPEKQLLSPLNHI